MRRHPLAWLMAALVTTILSIAYLSYVAPADGLLDIREAIITVLGLAAGLILTIRTIYETASTLSLLVRDKWRKRHDHNHDTPQ